MYNLFLKYKYYINYYKRYSPWRVYQGGLPQLFSNTWLGYDVSSGKWRDGGRTSNTD